MTPRRIKVTVQERQRGFAAPARIVIEAELGGGEWVDLVCERLIRDAVKAIGHPLGDVESEVKVDA